MKQMTAALILVGFITVTCSEHIDVHTVLIQASARVINWPVTEVREHVNRVAKDDEVIGNGTDGMDTASTEPVIEAKADSVIEENELVHFYNDVYSQTNSMIVFVDLRQQSCPIDLFRQRILGYITMSTKSCSSMSDVTAMATVTTTTWSFDLMMFMSDFLSSMDTRIEMDRYHKSFALLFDESGEDHFLSPNRKLTQTLVFEITLPLINCSSSEHVTNLAAKTATKDVIVMATSQCVWELMFAVSKLHLPYTRFRWLLYPTDSASFACNGFADYCDNIKPILLTERGKQQDRPVHVQGKLLSFAKMGINHFQEAMEHEDLHSSCKANCTTDCTACQQLFQEQLIEIAGQRYETFTANETSGRENIVFDMHRVASSGNIYLGNWSLKDGLDLNQGAYPDSFIDSQLSVVVIVEPPFIYRNDTRQGPRYYGYSMDVLKEISKRVGFAFTVQECDIGGYGMLENDKWTGCIGNVVRGEADVILGALTVTAERDRVIDFTLPYYDFAGIQILMKKQTDNIDLFYYANVFTTPAWLCLGAVVVVTSLLLWAFEKVTSSKTRQGHYSVNKPIARTSSIPLSTIAANNGNGMLATTPVHTTPNNKQVTNGVNGVNNTRNNAVIANGTSNNNIHKRVGAREKTKEIESGQTQPETMYTLGESIWFVVGALTMAGGGDPPRSLAGRLLIAGFWFFAVIMMSTFTANLAAFLTVSRMGMTISSLDDLAAQTDVKYSVVDQSSVMEYFSRMATIEEDFYERWKTMSLDKTDASQDSLAVWDYPLGHKYGAIWSTIKETGLIQSNEAGLEKVKSESFALITESPLIQFYTGKNCDLTAIGDQFSIRPYAIGLKERSPYTNKFSDAILELQKERELGSLRLKWWTNSGGSCPKETGNAGLDLYSLSGTFIVAGAGVGSGLIVLGLEHVFNRLRERSRLQEEQALWDLRTR